MSPEERSLLERTYKICKENNTILFSMRRTARVHLALRVSYWVLIVAISVGALYFIQPYFNFLTGSGDAGSQTENSFQTLQELLK